MRAAIFTGDTELSDLARRVLSGLGASYAENPVEESSTEIVGPVVGQELRAQARNATLFALLIMLVYIGFRFEPIFGVGATLATSPATSRIFVFCPMMKSASAWAASSRATASRKRDISACSPKGTAHTASRNLPRAQTWPRCRRARGTCTRSSRWPRPCGTPARSGRRARSSRTG